MKIAHEAPLSIFDKVQKLTDYDYALVHLFEESEEYYDQFVKAIAKGREVILDNSIFELEEAFDAESFAKWTEKLKPEWYIIPDALEKKDETIEKLLEFQKNFPDLPGKSIGVVQGKTVEEVIECYKAIEPKVDKVAISFDYSFMAGDGPTKYHNWVKGRQALLSHLVYTDTINQNKPHHLLGCGLPQEFKAYTHFDWIDSLDTSNPVVHGIKGIKYTEDGLENKESVKLFTLMDEEVQDKWLTIQYNIGMFRSFCQ